LGRSCKNSLADYNDFPVLNAEPSGVIYHPGRGSIFVASGHHLLEIKNGSSSSVVDHPFPGFDIEAVTLDPNSPDTLYLGLENPNQIVGLDLRTMTTYTPVNLALVMDSSDTLEALAVCPPALCGVGSKRFIAGGPSNRLYVLDLGNYPIIYPHNVKILDVIDIDALLCRRIDRCFNKTGRISDLYISSSAMYALSLKHSEVFMIPWSATAKSKFAGAPGAPQIMQLPGETNGNWQGFCLKPASNGNGVSAVLANDFHGFVKEFPVDSQGVFEGTC
jgi:hypothetical protein